MKVFIEFDLSDDYPSGADGAELLAKVIVKEFDGAGVTILGNDLWKDCGWCLDFEYQKAKCFVFFAKYFDGEQWQLTIESTGRLGLLSRVFAKKTPSYQGQLRDSTELILKSLKPIAINLSICLSSNTRNTKATAGELDW